MQALAAHYRRFFPQEKGKRPRDFARVRAEKPLLMERLFLFVT